MTRIIAIDPGNTISGTIILQNREITHTGNTNNVVTYELIVDNVDQDTVVLIEDIKPYSVPLRQQTVDTCKFIGVLEYRLKLAGIDPVMISRSEVKTWAFETYPGICIPKIEAKMRKKAVETWDIQTKELVLVYRDGRPWKPRKPSHNYVDDQIIVTCMQAMWGIEKARGRKGNSAGIRKHAWQALALASMFLKK
jgi:hypothetical protein